jgi:glycopeptide antibiotics resistance protein
MAKLLQMKSLSKTLLVLYLLTLLWLVLFKFSFDLFSVVLDHQTRSLNLIPFVGSSRANLVETVYNFVVFVPFGLLLGVNLKQISFWRKLAFIFIFSVTAELIQFVLAIGTTDVTDVITNTFGGLLGLILYDLSKKHINNEKLDRFITLVGMILLILFILLRLLVFRVKY